MSLYGTVLTIRGRSAEITSRFWLQWCHRLIGMVHTIESITFLKMSHLQSDKEAVLWYAYDVVVNVNVPVHFSLQFSSSDLLLLIRWQPTW